MNLKTSYLGMQLKNPLVVSASPLSQDLDSARRLEDAGAAAIVMYSLFEEEVLEEEEQLADLMLHQDIGHGEADTYLPFHHGYKTQLEEYLEQLQKLKKHLGIPVIASLNGISEGGWIEHARDLQAAGADALELNIYFSITNFSDSCELVEDRYVNILERTRAAVDLPIAVKVSPYFSALGNFMKRLDRAGADAAVLFNRFYQPDLELDTLEVKPKLYLSEPYEALLRMHWIARIYGHVKMGLAATGGVHSYKEALKMLLVGANVTQLCSVLLKKGPDVIPESLQGMSQWMEENEYDSVEQLHGSISQMHSPDPVAFERENYLRVLKSGI